MTKDSLLKYAYRLFLSTLATKPKPHELWYEIAQLARRQGHKLMARIALAQAKSERMKEIYGGMI